MKTTFYLNGTKVTKKAASEAVGKERLTRMVEEAKMDFFETR